MQLLIWAKWVQVLSIEIVHLGIESSMHHKSISVLRMLLLATGGI